MLEALQQVDLRFLTHQQKLAFWLNIYNTCIMHGFLQHDLPSNSEKMLALKNKATINVSGQKFNALVIENFILRQPSSVKEEFWKCDVDVKEQQVRGLYGLDSSEPNILFAMCCGTRSSPAVSSCTCLLPDAGGPRPPPQNNWKAPPSPTQASTFVGPRSHAGHRHFPPPAPISAVRSQ